MDELDNKIIRKLQADPRMSCAKIARFLHISEITVRKRIDFLITSSQLVFTALPDMRRLGYPVSSYIGLQLGNPSNINALAEELCKSTNLRFITSCQGFEDIFMRGEFESNEALGNFVQNMGQNENISRINTLVNLNQIKRNTYGRIESTPKRLIIDHPTIPIKEFDRRLIIELQKNCRLPLKILACKLNKNESTIYRRIRDLTETGLVELTAVPPLAKISPSKGGFILVETKLSKLIIVAKFLASKSQISNVGLFSGPIQILAAVDESAPENFYQSITEDLMNIPGFIRLHPLINFKVFKQTYSWLQ